MWRNARVASLEIVEEAEGLIRFHAERMSVSGTSRELYKGSRDSTSYGVSVASLTRGNNT